MASHALSLIFLTALSLTLSGCGDEPRRPPTDAGADVDTGAADTGGPDTMVADTFVPRTCPEDVVTGVTFDLDPDGVDTQIHASAVWDGERVIIAYNLPDPAGGFDVFVTSLTCDGTSGTPVRVNTTDFNDVDPEIARGASGYFVAWTSDDNTGGTDNLHVFGRALDASAMPIGTEDVEVRTSRAGEVVVGNHLITTLITEGDGYVVAGERGLESLGRFHAFAQRLDASGALAGEAFEPAYEPMVSHMNVVAASTAAGLVVAYDREPDSEQSQVVVVREGSSTAPERIVDGLVSTTAANLLATEEALFAALSGDIIPGATDIRLTELGSPITERPIEIIGAARRLDVASRIVWGEDSGAIAYFRLNAGSFGPLIVQRFEWDGSAFTVGPEIEVVSAGAAPYGPALTHVVGEVYFLAWSEGMSPGLRLKGRFVDLSP